MCIVSSLSAHCCIITGNFHLLTIGDRCTKYISDSRSVLFDTGIPSMHIFFLMLAMSLLLNGSVVLYCNCKYIHCCILFISMSVIFTLYVYLLTVVLVCFITFCPIILHYFSLLCFYVLWVLMAESNK